MLFLILATGQSLVLAATEEWSSVPTHTESQIWPDVTTLCLVVKPSLPPANGTGKQRVSQGGDRTSVPRHPGTSGITTSHDAPRLS